MQYFRILFLLILLGFNSASFAQFSIRAKANNSNQLDILYTAPVGFRTNSPVQFFEFAVQVANPLGASLTATFAPAAPLASIAAFDYFTGTDASKTSFVWVSSGVPIYANTYNFTAAEVVLGTVTFTGAPLADVNVFAVDYQDVIPYGGLGTQRAIWTMQINPTGDDVTQYSSLFYKSANAGTVLGSATPNTNSDYGTSNQQVSLLGGTLLPLRLVSFTATEKNCNAVLDWKTVDELNTKNFEVQTSTDGVNYTKATTINSLGLASSDYTATIPQYAATTYYRLKMVDKDNNVTYSAVLTLNSTCQRQDLISLYPNPVVKGNKATLSLTTSYKGNAAIRITNELGQLVSTKRIVVQAGINTYALETNFSSGVYFVVLQKEDGTMINKPIKLMKQ